MEIETVETTAETTTEYTTSADGRTVTETVTTTADTPVVRHCDCAECVQWEEDIADHLAYLTERLDALEQPTEGVGLMAENGATETVVEQAPPEKAEEGAKAKETPSEPATETPTPKKKKRHAGLFI